MTGHCKSHDVKWSGLCCPACQIESELERLRKALQEISAGDIRDAKRIARVALVGEERNDANRI